MLWKEAGCTTELDYVEQTSWLLFLKYLDDLEKERAVAAELASRTYAPILDSAHRWSRWAAPKDASGKLDHNRALTGPDLIDYVDRELFPYLQGFRGRSEPNTIEYKVGEIFAEIKNKFTSGYSLRDALDLSTSSGSAASPRSTSSPSCTKPRFARSATPAATAANITRRAR